MPVYKFVVANRVFAHCPIRFTAAQSSVAPAKMRKEPFVRGRRFAAVDANAHLIPRRVGLVLLSEASDDHQVSLGLSAGAPLLPRMG